MRACAVCASNVNEKLEISSMLFAVLFLAVQIPMWCFSFRVGIIECQHEHVNASSLEFSEILLEV